MAQVDEPATQSLRQRKKLKAREDILASARALISEQGVEAARMRDIAAGAGVSYQTLYHYFPTKSRILHALLLAEMEEMFEQASRVAYQGNVLTTLREINQLFFFTIETSERKLWLDASRDLLSDDRDQETLGLFVVAKEDSQATLELLLKRAQEFGELNREAPVSLIANTLFALIDYGFLRYLIDRDATPEGALEHLSAQIELVLASFLVPRA